MVLRRITRQDIQFCRKGAGCASCGDRFLVQVQTRESRLQHAASIAYVPGKLFVYKEHELDRTALARAPQGHTSVTVTVCLLFNHTFFPSAAAKQTLYFGQIC